MARQNEPIVVGCDIIGVLLVDRLGVWNSRGLACLLRRSGAHDEEVVIVEDESHRAGHEALHQPQGFASFLLDLR